MPTPQSSANRFVCLLTMLVGTVLLSASLAAAESQALKQYQEAVSKANLERYPLRHKRLADWCDKQGLTSQAETHRLAYARYQYDKKAKRYGDEPNAKDSKTLADLADEYGLKEVAASMRQRWMSLELAERRKGLAADDVKGRSKLLSWMLDQGAKDAAKELAKEILALDAQHDASHRLLGHIKVGKDWLDPWEALVKRGGLKDVSVRYAIHAEVDKARGPQRGTYAAKPMAAFKKVQPPGFPRPCLYEVPIASGDGKGRYFCHLPSGYQPSKPAPLIVYLHGGGNGGIPASRATAANNIGAHPFDHPDKPHIVIAPVLRVHPINAWNVQVNMLEVIDAIKDISRRCHIDKRRMYLYGSSMGGQGTQRFSWVVPECFAAFAPVAGAYWNKFPVPDLTGKPYLVLHGAKDAGFRNKSCEELVKKLRAAKADVTYELWPDVGHNMPSQRTLPKIYAFFDKHQNDFAPDLDLVRRLIAETVTEKPHGQGKGKGGKAK